MAEKMSNQLDRDFYRDSERLLINNTIQAIGICTVEITKVPREVEQEDGTKIIVEEIVYVGALETEEYIDDIDFIMFGNFIVFGVDVNRELISSGQSFIHYDFIAQGLNVVTEDMLVQEGDTSDK